MRQQHERLMWLIYCALGIPGLLLTSVMLLALSGATWLTAAAWLVTAAMCLITFDAYARWRQGDSKDERRKQHS